jgi:peptidoglycan/LPS O-acetylase OafA/YrhL
LITVFLAYGVYTFWVGASTPGQSWAGLVRHLTLTHIYTDDYLITYLHHGLSQTWSLAVEFSFYAALPLLAYLLLTVLCRGTWRPARLLVGLAVICCIAPVWLVVVHTTHWLPNSAGMWLPAHLGWFAGGMMVATLAAMGVRCRNTVAISLAALLFLVACTPVAGAITMGPVPLWAPLTKSLLYACIATLVLAALALGDGGWVERVLAARPMVWLGEISYEVFLLHVLVMALVLGMVGWPPFSGSFPTLVALTLAGTVPSAWVLSRLTRPARRTGAHSEQSASLRENPRMPAAAVLHA